ncbi:rad52/22 family double-strand break repair protein [Hirsutella rhossiliensis]|uniref:Rad52/22 family double-strand break repair protein n=1 Tax=Hirsutella rhossiliensis TaxID=111463 RepID=A0A9P8SKS9_9HYPO|nr:rad52/22 family double-strand break repair protein [Hirsutella rhossiliensis]KAH0966723.1 rad52/22 family double-strand break repair protein [Hirsutella rhossiliensis]
MSPVVKRGRKADEVNDPSEGTTQPRGKTRVMSLTDADVASGSSSSLAVLGRPLGPEYVQRRPGPGGSKLSYLSSADAISLANDMFGHDGWSSEVIEQSCESRTEGNPRTGPNFPRWNRLWRGDKRNTRAEAMEKAVKEAETDALKRALRIFGEALGNCLYSKPYLSWIEKVRAREGKQDETKHYTADILVRKPRVVVSRAVNPLFPFHGRAVSPVRADNQTLDSKHYNPEHHPEFRAMEITPKGVHGGRRSTCEATLKRLQLSTAFTRRFNTTGGARVTHPPDPHATATPRTHRWARDWKEHV